MSDEVDCLYADKHESFRQNDAMIFDGMYADKHESFRQNDAMIFDGMVFYGILILHNSWFYCQTFLNQKIIIII